MKHRGQNFFVIFCLIFFLANFIFLNLAGAWTTSTAINNTTNTAICGASAVREIEQKGFFSKIFGSIWNFIKKALKWLKENILDKIVNWLKGRKANVKQGIAEEREELKATLRESVKDIFSKLWENIKQDIKDIFR